MLWLTSSQRHKMLCVGSVVWSGADPQQFVLGGLESGRGGLGVGLEAADPRELAVGGQYMRVAVVSGDREEAVLWA